MASSYGSDASKTSIRSLYLTTRSAMPALRKDAADAAIRQRLEGLPLWKDATLLLSFVSYRDEIDTHTIISDALAQGKKVAVPLCDSASRSMTFRTSYKRRRVSCAFRVNATSAACCRYNE